MRSRLAESRLRTVVRMILEDKEGFGTRRSQAADFARLQYSAAQLTVEAIVEEMEKKKALEAKLNEMGFSLEDGAKFKLVKRDAAVVQKLLKDPKYDYDVNMIRRYQQAVGDLLKAKKRAAVFNPLIDDDVPASNSDSQPVGDLPDPSTKSYLSIDEIDPLTWYSWDDPQWKKVSANVPYAPKDKGTGPGEDRLAAIIGGRVQGGATSFDIVSADGKRWECKELKSASEKIRPGTEGRAVMIKPQYRMTVIMYQLQNFITEIRRAGLLNRLKNQDDVTAIKRAEHYLKGNKEKLLGGEISEDSFDKLWGILGMMAQLRARWEREARKAGDQTPVRTDIGLNDKVVKVDSPTFISVSKIVQKALPDEDIMSTLEEKEVIMNILKSDAFNDPTEWFNEWSMLISAEAVFRQVHGVFIISEKGFNMVPKSRFNDAFKIFSVSQAQPKFIYAYYNGVPQENKNS